jgi:hypothetical protein
MCTRHDEYWNNMHDHELRNDMHGNMYAVRPEPGSDSIDFTRHTIKHNQFVCWQWHTHSVGIDLLTEANVQPER